MTKKAKHFSEDVNVVNLEKQLQSYLKASPKKEPYLAQLLVKMNTFNSTVPPNNPDKEQLNILHGRVLLEMAKITLGKLQTKKIKPREAVEKRKEMLVFLQKASQTASQIIDNQAEKEKLLFLTIAIKTDDVCWIESKADKKTLEKYAKYCTQVKAEFEDLLNKDCIFIADEEIQCYIERFVAHTMTQRHLQGSLTPNNLMKFAGMDLLLVDTSSPAAMFANVTILELHNCFKYYLAELVKARNKKDAGKISAYEDFIAHIDTLFDVIRTRDAQAIILKIQLTTLVKNLIFLEKDIQAFRQGQPFEPQLFQPQATSFIEGLQQEQVKKEPIITQIIDDLCKIVKMYRVALKVVNKFRDQSLLLDEINEVESAEITLGQVQSAPLSIIPPLQIEPERIQTELSIDRPSQTTDLSLHIKCDDFENSTCKTEYENCKKAFKELRQEINLLLQNNQDEPRSDKLIELINQKYPPIRATMENNIFALKELKRQLKMEGDLTVQQKMVLCCTTVSLFSDDGRPRKHYVNGATFRLKS